MPGCYVVFHKQLGDLLLLEPALAKLRDHYGAPVSVMTRAGHAPLLRLIPGVEYQAGLPLAWRSHLYGFDPLNKTALRASFAPAFHKILVLPEKREMKWFHPLLFRKIIVPELRDRYVAEYFWEHTPVPASGPFRPPRLADAPNRWKLADCEDRSYVLVNPTSGWRKKSWLAARWAAVLRTLHEEWGCHFLISSGSADWQVEQCREIEKLAGPGVRSLAGHTPLKQFLWLCCHARMVLTVDGAASHLAAAFGVPCLTLFGPTPSANWHYPTPLSRIIQAPPDKDGKTRLKTLGADEVISAAKDLWLASAEAGSKP